jgi:hypothetical integral membrane protein (TIGR02206 family)
MKLLSDEHVVAIVVTALLCVLVVWAARARPGASTQPASRALGAVILAGLVFEQTVVIVRGDWSADVYLPLQLSDAVTLVAVLALWSGRPSLVELTYFWGLTAALAAVLTPALARGFPDLTFFTFFATHSGAVLAAVLLVYGRRLAPGPGAVGRAWYATLAVAAVAAVANLVTGGNYMFLRQKPDSSLLDLMGPWPLYIVSAGALGLALFAMLDAPFRRTRGSLR